MAYMARHLIFYTVHWGRPSAKGVLQGMLLRNDYNISSVLVVVFHVSSERRRRTSNCFLFDVIIVWELCRQRLL